MTRLRNTRQNFQKREFLLYTIAGAAITLLLGVIIGLRIVHVGKEEVNGNTDISKLIFDEMKAVNIKANLRYLAKHTHIAGSKQEEEILVNYIANRWRKQLDKVEVYPYDVMLSMPNASDPNYIGIIDKDGKIIRKSLNSECEGKRNCENVVPNFNAYGHKGHVETDMVFVNYASNDDFVQLSTLGISPKQKICIAKYGKMFRGQKSKIAEDHGCLGLVLYPDPVDFADYEKTKEVYPDAWFMPPSGTQKGSLWQIDGDPLTPFYPAIPSAYRSNVDTLKLPKIPVHPISYEDAEFILSKLNGPVAPKSWWGKLPLTYRLDSNSSDHKFVLHVGNERPIKTVRNVIGYLYGNVEPDRYVLLGNHRDAWDFGAIDPSSATAVMLELSRAMGELTKSEIWRPRRTIVFCSWAAEEFGLIGSTEWIEQMEKILFFRAVAYFNIDLAIQGNATLEAIATPNLQTALFTAAKKVPNPNQAEVAAGRSSVFDTWLHKDYDTKRPHLPKVGSLGSGSDYLMFLQKVGVSSLDFWYTYDIVNSNMAFYPIYHSAFENIHYFEKFLDPEYKFSLAVGQLWAEMAKMFADSTILPFSPSDYAYALENFVISMLDKNEDAFKGVNLNFDHLLDAVNIFKNSAHKLEKKLFACDKSNIAVARILNDKLMYLDRYFLDMSGLFDREYYRHLVFAPNTNDYYDSSELPCVMSAFRLANETGNWSEVERQISYLTFHVLSAATEILDVVKVA